MAGVTGFEPAPAALETALYGFEDRCATLTPHPQIRLFAISLRRFLIYLFLSFKWNSTFIVAALNRVILFYSIFFSFIEFIQATIFYNISSKAAAGFISVLLHLFVRVMSRLQRRVMLMSTVVHILALPYVYFTISVVSYFVYSTWRTSHYLFNLATTVQVSGLTTSPALFILPCLYFFSTPAKPISLRTASTFTSASASSS